MDEDQLTQIFQQVTELNKEIVSQLINYFKNKTNNVYIGNKEYTNYEDEIIEGESVMDCLLENLERNKNILNLSNELLVIVNELRKAIINIVIEQKKERKENKKKLNLSIKNLNEINEIEKKKETKDYEDEIKRIQNKTEVFIEKMKAFEKDMISKKCDLSIEEMKKLEKWSQKKMKSIVFDSDINKWEYEDSEFDTLIMNKENLLFLIETKDGIKFGGYISSKIDKTWERISDEHAFVYTFKDDKPLKFNIKQDKKDEAFCVHEKQHDQLFQFGYGDVILKRHKIASHIYVDDQSTYDYEGIEDALIGKSGDLCFEAKRVIVIQMK